MVSHVVWTRGAHPAEHLLRPSDIPWLVLPPQVSVSPMCSGQTHVLYWMTHKCPAPISGLPLPVFMLRLHLGWEPSFKLSGVPQANHRLGSGQPGDQTSRRALSAALGTRCSSRQPLPAISTACACSRCKQSGCPPVDTRSVSSLPVWSHLTRLPRTSQFMSCST